MKATTLKKALITGITGQDGSYLTKFLLDKGYKVHGIVPRGEVECKGRLFNVLDHPHLTLHDGDMLDGASLHRVLMTVQPDEIYNLAAQSHVGFSFHAPEYTANVNGLGTARLLEAMRLLCPNARFYQASSSELFGNAPAPQCETTNMVPCSPYAAAKLYAYSMVQIARKSYKLHASNGILFNHESPLRGEDFVTRKVTKAVAAIKVGTQNILELGNLDARRDWGHAADYVRGMWMMLQQDQPDDYILASGESHSVRYLVEAAFKVVNINITWQGRFTEEQGRDQKTGKVLVRINRDLYRPNDVHHLCGDASKAREVLGWQPAVSFDDLISEMVEEDMRFALQNKRAETIILKAENAA